MQGTAVTKHDIYSAKRFQYFRKKYIANNSIEAAKILGTSQATLSQIENGNALIRPELIDKLVTDYNMNRDWLPTGEGYELNVNPDETPQILDNEQLNREFSNLKVSIGLMQKSHDHLMKVLIGYEKKLNKVEGELKKTQAELSKIKG